jgi:hypothetical protein
MAASAELSPEIAAATAARRQGRSHDALALLDRAIVRVPDCAHAHAMRGMALLGLGRFEEGFAAYEWRQRVPGFEGDRPALPRWDGEALAGKTLLLWDEQGFGDTIQFARFVELARQSRARVVLRVHPRMRRLLSACRGADAVEAREGRPPVAAAQLSLMSIPAVMRLGAADLTADGAWLAPEPELARDWRRRLDVLAPRPGLRIGVAWQGNPLHPDDGRRSIPLSAFAPLVRAWEERATFISLQKGRAREAIVATALPLVDLDADLDVGRDAFVDTAAVISALDLVITSDTSVAHLAAALGAPVWLILASPCDWRWGEHGQQSLFYPTARLFRQPASGAWTAVFEDVAASLEAWPITDRRSA